ncbi:hypothetical protein BGZ65_012145, partial [Modicella reniformis]
MDEITQEHYEKARWIWCVQVMGLSATGSHNLFGTLEEAFHNHLEGLFRLPMTILSECNSGTCPQPVTIKDKNNVLLAIRDTRRVDQESIDDTLRPPSRLCKQRISEVLLERHGRQAFSFRSSRDPDTGIQTDWFECGGTKESERIEFYTLPYLLSIDTTYRSEEYNGAPDCPSHLVRIDGTEYHLAVIIFTNGSHFCCSVILYGRAVAYDGLKSRLLRWISPEKAHTAFPEKFRICQLWYVKTGRQEPESDTELPSQREPRSDEETVDPPHVVVDEVSTGRESDSNEDAEEVEDEKEAKMTVVVVVDDEEKTVHEVNEADEEQGQGEQVEDASEVEAVSPRRSQRLRRFPMGVTLGKVSGRGKLPD